MATERNITLRKGRTGSIAVLVSGVDDWTDLQAKLYASAYKGGSVLITLTGTIDQAQDTITFDYVKATTLNLVDDNLYYEVVIYKSDGSYIKDVVFGKLFIVDTVKSDIN